MIQSLRYAIWDAVYESMNEDDSIFILGEGARVKCSFDYPAILNRFPERVVTAPVAEAGIVNETRRVVPTTVVRAVAGVVISAPPATGFSVRLTLAGAIVPAGKLDPVMLRLVTPGSPALGDVVATRVTGVGLCVRASSDP